MAKRARLSTKQIEALRRIDSATIANAIETFDVRDLTAGYASFELRCLFPELPPTVGFAVTCTVDTTTPARDPQAGLGPLARAIEVAPQPVVVVMQATGQDHLRSCHIGDMLSTVFQRLGAVGAVADAGVRDLAGIAERAPGFQIFAAGTVVSHGAYRIVEVGGQVSIRGLPIAPGDLLHGDANGLLTVPRAIAGRVAARARQIHKSDAAFAEFVKGPEFSTRQLAKRHRATWG